MKTITVGYGPNAIAITPGGKTAYVVSGAQTCGTCSHQPPPLQIATGTPGRPIPAGIGPGAVAITP